MSNRELEYHIDAAAEVAQVVDWYEQIDSHVATKFKLELARAERLVLRSPAAWGHTFTEQKGFVLEGSRS